MKILFAVDGSERALAPLDVLIAHVSWFKEPPSITLVNVNAPLPYGGGGVGRARNCAEALRGGVAEGADAFIGAARGEGDQSEGRGARGDPAEEIAKYAASHG